MCACMLSQAVSPACSPELTRTLCFRLQNWMLDGFPRTLAQAGLLGHSLEVAQKPINMMINLQVPASVILDRIRGQSTVGFLPPRTHGR